jgi:hypothetical protein
MVEIAQSRNLNFLRGPKESFADNKFFNDLPPNLQKKLVEKCLESTLDLLTNFFCDITLSYETEQVIRNKIVTNLGVIHVDQNIPILRAGEIPS